MDEQFVALRESTILDIVSIYEYILKKHSFEYGSVTVQLSTTLDIKLSKGT